VGQWYQPEKTLLSIAHESPNLEVLRLRQVQFIHSDKIVTDAFDRFHHFKKLELAHVNINDQIFSIILWNNYQSLIKLKINHCMNLLMNQWNPSPPPFHHHHQHQQQQQQQQQQHYKGKGKDERKIVNLEEEDDDDEEEEEASEANEVIEPNSLNSSFYFMNHEFYPYYHSNNDGNGSGSGSGDNSSSSDNSYRYLYRYHYHEKPHYHYQPIQFLKLTYLDLKGCHHLSREFLESILKHSPSLSKLRLDHRMDIDKRFLDKILVCCQALNYFSLSQCPTLTDETILHFLKRKYENYSKVFFFFLIK